MPKKTSSDKTRCIFCNSLSHVATKCNSNMKGRRKLLNDIGWSFMLDDEIPDFYSFSINELRFIASIYYDFQKETNKRSMKEMYMYFDRPFVIDYLCSPIPLTLTKSRMITEFINRWNMFAKVRVRYKEKPEDEDCPICMERMTDNIWNPTKLNWDRIACRLFVPGAMFNGNMKTSCGHIFCGTCWEHYLKTNSKPEYRNDRFFEEPTGQMILSCPMCRSIIRHNIKLPSAAPCNR